MLIFMLANFKGGCGKSTLCHHIAEWSRERGLRVLVIDTDKQGNLYRRLAKLDHNPQDRPPMSWAKGCVCMYSPKGWALPDKAERNFDVVVIDTPPGEDFPMCPPGVTVDVVVIPIDGIDAALGANETVANALDNGVPTVVIVKNGVEEGGKRFHREFANLTDGLPENVVVAPVEIPRGDGIKRTQQSNRPAWSDPYKGNDTRKIRELCEWLGETML